jgi:hypothetical protein
MKGSDILEDSVAKILSQSRVAAVLTMPCYPVIEKMRIYRYNQAYD